MTYEKKKHNGTDCGSGNRHHSECKLLCEI